MTRRLRRGVMAIVLVLLTDASFGAALAQAVDDLTALNKQVTELYHKGRYAEAVSMAERALALAQRMHGAGHPDVATPLSHLALLYQAQGRYGEAETLFNRALAGREQVLGKEHPDTLASVNHLAVLYHDQGRYGEAEPLFTRTLETRKRVLGKEHADTLISVNNLAGLYKSQGRHADAEPLYRRALAAQEHVLGTEHPHTLISVNNLAALYDDQGRYEEAEPLYQRALEAHERVLGREHPNTLASVSNLAAFYDGQGRYDEAEPLYQRALEAQQRVLGREHPSTLASVNNLAGLYDYQGRYDEAELLYRRVLEAQERVLGKEHPETLGSLNNLALLYNHQGRHGEAEPLYKRALDGKERILGKEHPETLRGIINLGALYRAEGRYGEAEALLKRAREASESVLGKEHPLTLDGINNLAWLYFVQRDWSRAAQLWRQNTRAIVRRSQRGAQTSGRSLIGKKRSVEEQSGWQFRGLIKAVSRLVPKGSWPAGADVREMFQTAQWVLSSEAAQSVAQMAARGAGGNSALAALVRERQDLVAEWQKRDMLRNAALAQMPQGRNAKAEAENLARLAGIDAQVAQIDRRLAAEFPDYAALANPVPLSVEEVQAELRADEALIFFLDTRELQPTPEETFIWIVTKADSRWVGSALGTSSLRGEVTALRCGLDATGWHGKVAAECADLLGIGIDTAPTQGEALPFRLARAHKLYMALFGEVEDLILGKHLLVVPSGPLTQLPFQALVTSPPASGDLRTVAWLARSHAVTVLPAVSALKALRRVATPSAATKPMIGFGNPLLDGPDSRYAQWAQLAREQQSCQEPSHRRLASSSRQRGGIPPVPMRGGLADLAHLKALTPLPETAEELCAVARSLQADVSEVRLGARATERDLKSLSATGALAQYRLVLFATHGALAGELTGTSEPGLILTPPQHATPEDDGYLSASEIASLKLDADWVILSACNTAAGGASSAEALSGLARAFFYAQARALLVSHWAVDSNATVKLITSAVREIARDAKVGRAEGLRRAMLALIDKGASHEAHPAYWAPFIVVGEGAAR